jgi:exodeoxyribonuclease V alpha subunit
VVALEALHAGDLANLEATCEQTAIVAKQAEKRAEAGGAAIAAHADRVRDTLVARWDGERDAARTAASVVRYGQGWLGLRRGAVARAEEQLTDWAHRWRPHVPALPTDPKDLAQVAGWFDDRPALWRTLDASAHRAAEQARLRRDKRLDPFGPAAWTPDPAGRLADLQRDIATTRQELTDARTRIATLTAEPALRTQRPDRLTREREAWRTRRTASPDQRGSTNLGPTGPVSGVPRPEEERLGPSLARRGTAPGVGR